MSTLRLGVGGPVGSGKTALVAELCRRLGDDFEIAAVTNDIYTREDAEFLMRAAVLPAGRVVGVESGGDNLAASFSPELVDASIYVVDVAGGDKVPRKGGPGVTRSELLVINKIDLAPLVDADLSIMERDANSLCVASPPPSSPTSCTATDGRRTEVGADGRQEPTLDARDLDQSTRPPCYDHPHAH